MRYKSSDDSVGMLAIILKKINIWRLPLMRLKEVIEKWLKKKYESFYTKTVIR